MNFNSWKAKILGDRDTSEHKLSNIVWYSTFVKLGMSNCSPALMRRFHQDHYHVFQGRSNNWMTVFWEWLDEYSNLLCLEVDNHRRLTPSVENLSPEKFETVMTTLEKLHQAAQMGKKLPVAVLKPQRRCTHCGKEGHMEQRCWHAHPHLKPVYRREGRQQEEPKEAGATLNSAESKYYVLFDSGNLRTSLCSSKVAVGRMRRKAEEVWLVGFQGTLTAASEVVDLPLSWKGRELGHSQSGQNTV